MESERQVLLKASRIEMGTNNTLSEADTKPQIPRQTDRQTDVLFTHASHFVQTIRCISYYLLSTALKALWIPDRSRTFSLLGHVQSSFGSRSTYLPEVLRASLSGVNLLVSQAAHSFSCSVVF
jgi:hypothetical protein